ncbi:coat protein [Physalis mottle virus]|uniref:Capsid protein n=2 Tax=Physalis mottle virus TaxID=72539 RepID=CAPSD_PHMV|nr:coat protein [Physalis mottle virus]P36351.1 RecName: Full=Coat protein; AltName: Full=Virion protein [Physalis mottle virus]1E57_A Chain A, PHYSALIS MOTTLE VIRUS [Physalis mottle virus]1E57_B Chain B, PHYSALIS MOTTLE VIRUS [Physalis mottle virus]1E57_C Chain C, PHYSALIS MOTTLE VIRUS [Physalis mottle virus]1QJZ_A Chain A, COAT PROTEIN [Physalis mottle virus]1QJZ_B Chain B, COAT PROTEIN [Physalis mottle virus]1QJZ_C Chain C, COAT PROTEIN [Physalis mottle virus]2WWS_A Chain A, Coat Protein
MDSSEVVKVKQASIPAPGSILSQPNTEQSPAIVLPFQFEATTFGTAETAAQVSLQTADPITKLTAPYRHAQIVECKAILTPTDLAVSNPLTVYLAWVPANSPATPTQILRVYGGQSFVLGGAISAAKTIEVPLNLDSVNRMLKDSVTYTDTPKLLAYSRAPTNPSKIPTASIQISGRIRLSKPMLIAN